MSDVALGLAKNRAAVAGFDLMTAQVDLEDQTLNSVLDRVLTAWSVDESPIVLSCFHYLNRTLLASVADGLPPGATFMASIATAKNLERHSKPSARFLLDPGELRALVAGMGPSDHPENLSLIHYFEGWNAEGNHEAEIIVRRPRHSSDWAERPMHKVRSQR